MTQKQPGVPKNLFVDERVYILNGTLVAETMYEGYPRHGEGLSLPTSLFRSLVGECIGKTHQQNMKVVKCRPT